MEHDGRLTILAYSDSRCADCRESRGSTSGACLLSCAGSSNRGAEQATIATSSGQAEYGASAGVAAGAVPGRGFGVTHGVEVVGRFLRPSRPLAGSGSGGPGAKR